MPLPLHKMGPGTHSIGRHTYYPPDLSLRTWQPQERISIGSFCSIASEVVIHAGGIHRSDYASTFPFRAVLARGPHPDPISKTTRPTKIGNDVWISDRAVILGGVRVGHGAIIGAGSVVFEKVPPYAVVAGNPASVLWYRFPPELVQALLRIAWWNWTDDFILANIDWFYKPARDFVARFAAPS